MCVNCLAKVKLVNATGEFHRSNYHPLSTILFHFLVSNDTFQSSGKRVNGALSLSRYILKAAVAKQTSPKFVARFPPRHTFAGVQFCILGCVSGTRFLACVSATPSLMSERQTILSNVCSRESTGPCSSFRKLYPVRNHWSTINIHEPFSRCLLFNSTHWENLIRLAEHCSWNCIAILQVGQ